MKTEKGMTEKEADTLRKNPINEFTCCNETRDFKDHRDHLLKDHKLKVSQLKGKNK